MTADQCLIQARQFLDGSNVFDEMYEDALAEAMLRADGDADRAQYLLPNILKAFIEDLELGSERKAKQLFYMIESINNLTRQVDNFIAKGKSPFDAITEVLEANYDAAANEAREALKAFHIEIDSNKLNAALSNPDNYIKIGIEITELSKVKGKRGISKDKDAQKIAEIYERYVQSARAIMLKLGVPIANLEGRMFRQIFSREMLSGMSKEKFIDDILPRIDEYKVFGETGVSVAAKRKYIGDYFDDVVSGRIQDIEPSLFDASVQKKTYSRRQSEHRYLHLKTPEDMLHSLNTYTNMSFIELMESTIRNVHYNKALIQNNGVNPRFAFDKLRSNVMAKHAKDKPDIQAKIANSPYQEAIYREGTKDYGNVKFSPFMADLQEISLSVVRLVYLGGAGIASTGDVGTAMVAAHKIGASGMVTTIDAVKSALSGIRSLPFEEQRGALAGVEMGSAYAIGAFQNFIGRATVSGKMAKGSSYLVNKMFQYNGLSFVTKTMKTSAAMTFKAQAKVYSNTKWDNLNKGFVFNLMRGGITPEEWGIVNANADAMTRNFLGHDYIDPYMVYDLPDSAFDGIVGTVKTKERYDTIRDQVRQKLMAAVTGFADEAVPTAGVKQRAIMYGGQAPGTAARLIFANMSNLISYPLTYMSKVAYRNFEATGGVGSVAGMAGYMVATSLFYGAIADYLSNLNKGRVRDYEGMLRTALGDQTADVPYRQFLVESALKGGLGGIVASTLVDYALYDRSPLGVLAAPSAGIIADTGSSIRKIMIDGYEGDYNKAFAETLDVVTNLLPAEFPIAGTAYYNIVYFPMMEMLDPKKINRIEKNWKERTGGEYFITPE